MIYLARVDYEGDYPVYMEGGKVESWVFGDDQLYFDFCPLCGKKIDRPQVESVV